MAVIQYRTFGDIYTAVREELGIQSSDTVAINRIKRDVNLIYAEVAAKKSWEWLKTSSQLQLETFITAGLASVTSGSNLVTLDTPPMDSKTGYKFAIDGYNEIFTIDAHTGGTGTLLLSGLYTGASSATSSYRIWNDSVALPTDFSELLSLTHGHQANPLDVVGVKEWRRLVTPDPRAEGRPSWAYVGDYINPAATAAIAGLAPLLTRSSSGLTKTLVFSNSLPTSIATKMGRNEPVLWNIRGAGHPSYNGDVVLATLTSTNVANDTITYTGRAVYNETPVADTTLTVLANVATITYNRYRQMFVYPALSLCRVSLDLDYIREVYALENDSDEPLIPVKDRSILLYGAAERGWRKKGSTYIQDAEYNKGLYQEKLTQMEGKLVENQDKPRISPSKMYLSAKRNVRNGVVQGSGGGTLSSIGGGGAAGAVVTGLSNHVAVYNSRGLIDAASPTITEINYVAGVTSGIQAQLDAPIVDADVATAAAIQRSKLAPGTPGQFLVNDGSGNISDSGYTTANFGFLTGAVPLTTVSLTDNTATPTTCIWVATTSASIAYTLSRGSALESGIISLITDGINAAIAQGAAASLGTLGVTFTAAYSGGYLVLNYTTTSTGSNAQLKYKLHNWTA